MPDSRQNIEISALASLSEAISKIAQNDGDFTTEIGALSLHRRNTPTTPVHCIYQMGLGVVAQGAKQVMLAGKPTYYRAGESLLTTVDLPVVSHVTQASAEQPFLGLMLVLDPQTVAQLAAVIPPAPTVREAQVTPLSVELLDHALADALLRLVTLLAEPALIAQVAPLIQQEIIVRLLTGPYSSQLRQMATAGTPGQQIAKVVGWLKQNFTRQFTIDELAASAYMSPSTFRHHFRHVTGVSPLQFQKKLRLQEARQQMMNKNLDASSAALFVGYESASQFSREYSREFGESPWRDIRRLRAEGESGTP